VAPEADFKATTLLEYIERIETLSEPDELFWYRGTGRVSYDLKPSLFRHPTIVDPKSANGLEADLLQRYRERSIPYQVSPWNRDRDHEWEALFIMQHFGVPTRLLDWTESPFIGLFFALTSASLDFKTDLAAEDACVWILRPSAWNKMALSDISYPGGVLSIDKAGPLQSYAPSADFDYMRLKPVAMNGLHNSPRIVAQKGAFTIFGKSTESMESHVSDRGSTSVLQRIIIPAARVGPLRRDLARMGITDSVVYPDLEGLARELKRHYGFPV